MSDSNHPCLTLAMSASRPKVECPVSDGNVISVPDPKRTFRATCPMSQMRYWGR
jgi:hypothetical protein